MSLARLPVPIRLCAAAAVAAGLAACTAPKQDIITRSYLAPTYGPTTLSAARKYDSVPVDIVGNPFPVPDAILASRVIDALNTTGSAGDLTFTAGPADPKTPYQMVVVFDPSPGMTHQQVCRGARRQTEDPGTGVPMMLTYCLGKKPLTSLRARQTGFDGPDDPAFTRFVRNATTALLPKRNRIKDGGGPDGNGDFF